MNFSRFTICTVAVCHCRTSPPFLLEACFPSHGGVICGLTHFLYLHHSIGPLWALRLPDLRSTPPLFPHLHILPGARDTWHDV